MTKKVCLIPLLVVVALAALFIYGSLTQYDKVEIKQNVGGTLICNSIYYPDLNRSYLYDISIKYEINNDTVDIGSGRYYNREWKKDEQLIKYKNWLILKTGSWIGTDRVIIGNLKTKHWKGYDFVPDSIEKDSLWLNSKTRSLLNWCCSEAFIDTISNGQIVLNYKFRTSETQTEEYGQRKVYYTINELTGLPIMIKVE